MTHICGDKSLFAIECRIDFESETPARNAIGEITFWAWWTERRQLRGDLDDRDSWCGLRGNVALVWTTGGPSLLLGIEGRSSSIGLSLRLRSRELRSTLL
jgi:hypothetical protein